MASFGKTHQLLPLVLTGLLTACHNGAHNQPPEAVIVVNQPAVEQLTTFAFSAKASRDLDGNLVAFRWDFGDSHGSTDVSPTHVFDASGNYLVSLTVTDDRGATSKATHQIEIAASAVSRPSSVTPFSVDLPGIASVEAPAAAFASPTRIGVWTTSATSAANFAPAAHIFPRPLRATREIRVNSGAVAPALVFSAVVHIPAELQVRLRELDEPQVFIQLAQSADTTPQDNIELVESLYDVAAQTLRFELTPRMFTKRYENSWEAVIVVGATRTWPASSEASGRRFAHAPPGVRLEGG